MTVTAIINLVSNAILTASISGFYILLYRDEGVVRRWPMIGSWLLKLSLVTTAAGSLANCVVMSDPDSVSEIVLNVGLAGIFSWAVMFHMELLRNKYGSTPKSGKRSSRSRSRQNSGNTRKGPTQ